jgi:hypothetical protein
MPQADLPKDPEIMSATCDHNENNVGVYAEVLRDGRTHRRDRVVFV